MPQFPVVDELGDAPDFTAHWIAPRENKPSNFIFLARRAFTLSEVPKRAVLRVAAESRYVLYLNGERVGEGPVRGTAKRTFFDSYDVAEGLRAGENYLAAEVYCPVEPVTMAMPPIAPALLVELESLLGTDASWEVIRDPSRRPDALLYTHHIGFSDSRDLRRELVGWQTFRDGAPGWELAEQIAEAQRFGERPLVPRDIPGLTDDPYRPAVVGPSGSVPAHDPGIEDEPDYAQLMETEPHMDAPRVDDAAALTRGGPARVLPGTGGAGAFVIVDFSHELCGNFVLDVEAPAGAIVDVGYDEVVANARIHPLQINPNGLVYRYADRYILRGGRQRIENRLQERGLRVLQLTFRRFAEPIIVHGVEVTNRLYPSPVRATFECDDPFLNRLWSMCVETMTTCCTDLLIDCPWREQSLWIDDQPFESLYYLELTADSVFPARNLRVSADGALPNGLIPARYPSVPHTYFRSMSALWTLIVADVYLHTGDLPLLRELLPIVDSALAVYDEWRDADGLVPYGDEGWNFIDWGYDLAGAFMAGKAAVLNMLIGAAYGRAAWLHDALGDPQGARGLEARAQHTARAVRERFWLHDQQRFYDCTEPVDGRRTYSQLPHAIGLHFGLLDADQRDGALDALLSSEVIHAEYGFQLYVLRAMAECGRAPDALMAMRTLWAPPVLSDSPTVWEVSQGRDARIGGFITAGSLCQGYSCAPIDFAQRVLLGVRPLAPGFREFALSPQSLGIGWARGDVPTPAGPVHVAWSAQPDGSVRGEVGVPEGTTAVLPDGTRLAAGTHRLGEL